MLPNGALAFCDLAPAKCDNGRCFSLCGSQVACFPWSDYADGGTHGWFVVSPWHSNLVGDHTVCRPCAQSARPPATARSDVVDLTQVRDRNGFAGFSSPT